EGRFRCAGEDRWTALGIVEAVEQAKEQVGLVGEVVVDRAVGDACILRDIANGRTVEPFAREDSGRGVEDLCPPDGDELRLDGFNWISRGIRLWHTLHHFPSS